MMIREGIWTPWASVLCLNCHGRGEGYTQIVDEAWARRNDDLTGPEGGEGLTKCDKCGVTISVREDVAAEHNLVDGLKEAGINSVMAQTGGMCSAAEITLGGPNLEGEADYIWVTLAEDESGTFLVGYYPYMTYGYDRACEGWVFDYNMPSDQVVEFVKGIKERYDTGEREFGGTWE